MQTNTTKTISHAASDVLRRFLSLRLSCLLASVTASRRSRATREHVNNRTAACIPAERFIECGGSIEHAIEIRDASYVPVRYVLVECLRAFER